MQVRSFCKWHVNRWFCLIDIPGSLKYMFIQIHRMLPKHCQIRGSSNILVSFLYSIPYWQLRWFQFTFASIDWKHGPVRWGPFWGDSRAPVLRQPDTKFVFPLSILISGLKIKLDSQIMRAFEFVQHRVAQVSLIDPFDRLDSKMETCGFEF